MRGKMYSVDWCWRQYNSWVCHGNRDAQPAQVDAQPASTETFRPGGGAVEIPLVQGIAGAQIEADPVQDQRVALGQFAQSVDEFRWGRKQVLGHHFEPADGSL